MITESSRLLLYTNIMVFALCGLSLTVLTGWCGQLSLGQMAFAGIGALLAARLSHGIDVDIGWGARRILDAGLEPLPAVAAVAAAALITAAIAAAVGIGALRVRGLFLAVSTFAFGLAAMLYLYRRPILRGEFRDSVPFRRGELFGIDITSQRGYYYAVLVVLAVAVAVVARLRRTGVGRSTIAVRENPDMAAALTVGHARIQLQAFALGGGVAALAGALLAANLQSVPTDRYFMVEDSLLLVAIVVIGGLGAVSGPILGALWVIGVPAFFPDNDIVPLLTSGLGLLVLLLYLPGGLMQVVHRGRDGVLGWAERRYGTEPVKRHRDVPLPESLRRPKQTPRGAAAGPALQAWNVSVAFGGKRAVSDVSLRVDRNEVVGLIGANGAGKSTLMNAIGGFEPCQGRIELMGVDVSGPLGGQSGPGGTGPHLPDGDALR